jgi:hypothetical protein
MRNVERFPIRPPTVIKGKLFKFKTHFNAKQRQLYINIAKYMFSDLEADIDGNDKWNLQGILKGSDITEADRFFDMVYDRFLIEWKKPLKNPAQPAGGDGGAGADDVEDTQENILGDTDGDESN